MMNVLFDVMVRFVDNEFNKFSKTHRIYGKDAAFQYGVEFGICENVKSVDVCDAFTGEVLLTMENGELVFQSEE